MKKLQIAIASAFIATSGASFAQSQNTSDPTRVGQSPRCDAMTGDARIQCLKDENEKTQSAPSSSDSTSSGSSAAPATTGPAAGSEANSTPSASDTAPQDSAPAPQGESK